MQKKWLMDYNVLNRTLRTILSLVIISMILLSQGCTHEEDTHLSIIKVSNQSNQSVELIFYRGTDVTYENLRASFLIKAGREEEICRLNRAVTGILERCYDRPLQVIVLFPNGKGHYCASFFRVNRDDNSLCFENESFLGAGPPRAIIEGKGNFVVTYYITQEDYENAHVLLE